MARVIKVATISKTTTGTMSFPTGMLPNVPGQRGFDYFLEITSVGTGDTWQAPTVNYLSPNAVVTTIGTFASVTQAGTKAMTWVYAGTGNMAAPTANHFNVTLQTAGSASIAANLYIITDSF